MPSIYMYATRCSYITQYNDVYNTAYCISFVCGLHKLYSSYLSKFLPFIRVHNNYVLYRQWWTNNIYICSTWKIANNNLSVWRSSDIEVIMTHNGHCVRYTLYMYILLLHVCPGHSTLYCKISEVVHILHIIQKFDIL